MKTFAGEFLCIAILSLLSQAVATASTWNWMFDTERGQFITDGFGYEPGTYTLSDFVVAYSAVGGTVGSLSDGDYETGEPAFSTEQPFSFDWDGTSVVSWHHAGPNSFDWWAFDDVAGDGKYLFGWDLYNINDPASAAYWLDNSGPSGAPALGTVTVSPVPEPTTFTLLGLGSLALVMGRRRL